MKNVSATLILTFVSIFSFSQLRFYTEAGFHQSRPIFLGGNKNGTPAETAFTGFTASIGSINKISNSFHFNTKISFIRKKFYESFFVEPDYYGSNEYKVSALQFHVLAEKNISLKRKLQFFPSLGFYTTMHTDGTVDYEIYNFGNYQKGQRDLILNKNGDFRRWDAGLSFGIKTQWKKYFFQFLTDAGIVEPSLYNSNKWGSVKFTVGYFFK
ncbi:MAG: hypothetical protein IPQ25_02490 [Chitinophagaceae bacterium]|nr:hypothetical protein [Chitinophagaceae bacterium]